MKSIRSPFRLAMATILILALAICSGAKVSAAQPPAAKQIVDEALASAKREDKPVFLVFGGPGCVWCKVLEKFLESLEIKPIGAKYFVAAHLQLGEDATSNPGAAEFYEKYKGEGGIPFHVFLKSDGTAIVDSRENGTGGNIGYPAASNEIKWFMTMLEKAAPAMAASERAAIETKLKAFKKPASGTTAAL